MTDLEPDVLALVGMEAQTTTDIVLKMFPTSEADARNRRGAVFKTLRTLERKGLVESRVVRVDSTPNPPRYWALPGGSFPIPKDILLEASE